MYSNYRYRKVYRMSNKQKMLAQMKKQVKHSLHCHYYYYY